MYAMIDIIEEKNRASFFEGFQFHFMLQGKLSHTLKKMMSEEMFLSAGPLLGVRWAWNSKASFMLEILHEEILRPNNVQRFSGELVQTYLLGSEKRWLIEGRWSKEITTQESQISLGLYHYF